MVTPPPSLIDLMRSSPRRAPVILFFLATNVAVFLLMLLFGAGWWHTPNGVQLAWGANFGPATQDGQWWRLFTAMFIHFGVIHLSLNMWALWDVGRLVEQLYGRWRFAVLYLGSGVVGNLVSLVMQGNQAVSGGASGAVFSLYGALLVFLWRERRHVDRGEFRWLFGGAVAFSALMLVMGHLVQGIDNSAHVGGLVAGMLLGGLLAWPWTPQSPPVRRANGASLLLLLLALVLLMTRLPPPTYLLGDELRARAAIEAFLVQDQSASKTLDRLLNQSANDPRTFDTLAGRIETDVSAVYAKSFEQLQQTTLADAAPSAATLQSLRDYADRRAGATHALAQSIRAGDVSRACKALQKKQVPDRAVSAATTALPHASNPECANPLR